MTAPRIYGLPENGISTGNMPLPVHWWWHLRAIPWVDGSFVGYACQKEEEGNKILVRFIPRSGRSGCLSVAGAAHIACPRRKNTISFF